MGIRLIQLMAEASDLVLAAAVDRGDHPRLGEDAGEVAGVGRLGVRLAAGLTEPVDVAIDFSTPAASLGFAETCADRSIALVVGTTGYEPEQRRTLEMYAARIPMLISANFSRAVNLLMRLTAEAARILGDAADIEIVERHHRFKKDAPSGTALRLAEIAAQAIGREQLVYGRRGQVGERPRGEIGVHALRTGDNPGEHTVVFGLMGECLELSHRALNRDGFCRGALEAARFLAGRPARLYTMDDLLDATG
jgi:4-hydroxy-tetrahydrodipicolinate reductase